MNRRGFIRRVIGGALAAVGLGAVGHKLTDGFVSYIKFSEDGPQVWEASGVEEIVGGREMTVKADGHRTYTRRFLVTTSDKTRVLYTPGLPEPGSFYRGPYDDYDLMAVLEMLWVVGPGGKPDQWEVEACYNTTMRLT